MPEVTGGAIIKAKSIVPSASPVVNTSSTSTAPQPAVGHSWMPSKKLLIITGGVLVLLIAAAAFGYWKFFGTTPAPAETTPEPIVEEEPKPNPDVTTPGDWQSRYFGSEVCLELVSCGDKADPDRDGLDNKAEYDKGTDPNNNDGDSDGVADGDEVNIFGMDPLLSRTYREGQYLDSDFIKGGYHIVTDEPYTDQQLLEIKSKIKQYGLHQPTLTTLGPVAFQLYEFTDPNLPQLPANLDQSPQAKLDRDTQRQSTIKKVGGALIKYQAEKKSFPPTDDFIVMADLIRSYNMVATNYNDPVGISPFLYGYQATSNNNEFTLTYYSETQNQLIKYTSKNAVEDVAKEDSKMYDEKRKEDLESIQQALRVYSTTQLEPGSEKMYVFPPADKLKTELARYITQIPTDPTTKLDYVYQVGPNFDTFTIKAVLQNPRAGSTGYLCNQMECKEY